MQSGDAQGGGWRALSLVARVVARITSFRGKVTGRAALGVKVVGLCALAILAGARDPLDLGKVTDAASRSLLNRAFAPEYQGRQEKVVVVLLTDRTLKLLNASWPMNGGLHGRIITEILASHPRALFMDFLFVDQRATWSPAAILDARNDEPEIPVFLATPPQGSNAHLVSGLDAAVAAGQFIPVSIQRDLGAGEEYRYSLARDGQPPSAALAMYRQLCVAAETPWAACGAPILDDPQPVRDLEIFWGGRGPDYSQRLRLRPGEEPHVSCSDAPQNWVARVMGILLGRQPLRDSERLEPAMDGCPYATTIFAEDLLRNPLRFEPLLQDAAVIYGASLVGNADVVVSPNAGPLAYAYAHAMALDNLLTYGRNYLSTTDAHTGWVSVGHFAVGSTILVYLLMYGFVLWSLHLVRLGATHAIARPGAKARFNRWALRRHAAWVGKGCFAVLRAWRFIRAFARPYLPVLIYFLAAATMLGLLLLVEVLWLRLSPTNWLGLLSLATFSELLITPTPNEKE